MILRLRRILWLGGAPARFALILAIRSYRMTLSPVLGGQCRFSPTCSRYAEEAVRAAGALRGTVLAAWRILRCSPLTTGGDDPPPRAPAWRGFLCDSLIHSGRSAEAA